MVTFEHESITGPSDFRLLKLQPGRGTEPLVSSLIISSLNDRSYIWTALSYTWGNPDDRGELTCNEFKYQSRQICTLHCKDYGS